MSEVRNSAENFNKANSGEVYVLCGCSDAGALFEEQPAVHPPRYRGLLLGRGSPALANMGSKEWAIAKIFQYWEVFEGDLHAVSFEEYELLRHGEPFEIVTAIVGLGADPREFSFQFQYSESDAIAITHEWGLVRVGGSGVARSGNFGRAKAGLGGIAQVGHDGFAIAESYGVALADESGSALAGDYGIAVSDGKRFGAATAGTGGIAVGRGRYKHILTGDFGIAILQGSGRARAGVGGVAICWTDVAEFGADGLAVGTTVSGDLGTLLVATYLDFRTGLRSHAVGLVGHEGLRPFQAYICVDGKLVAAETALDRDVIV